MAKTLCIGGSSGSTVGANSTRYSSLSGYVPNETSETFVQLTFRSAGTLSNLYVKVTTNTIDGSSTFRTRKNLANGNQSVSIGTSTTGEFEDTANSDSIAAGDEANYQLVTGGTTGNILVFALSSLFNATTNTVAKLNTRENAVTAAATTFYRALCSMRNESLTTEPETQFKIGTAGTLKNLYVYVSTNSVTAASTVRSRKNAANGNLSVSITASTTGVFEDTTNSDTVASGDKLNWQIVTGSTGTSMTAYNISGEFESTNASFPVVFNRLAGFGVGAADGFMTIAGGAEPSTTENPTDANIAGTARNLWCYISANGRTTNTDVVLRKNSASTALTIAIAGAATGEFEDATNSVTFVATDELNYAVITGTGSGTFTFRTIGCTLENTEAGIAGRITASDSTLTYSEKVGRTTASDATLTYSEKTGRVTASSADLTYSEKLGRVTASSADLTYGEKVGRTTAADATLTYSEKVARATAASADLTYSEKVARITATDATLTYTEAGAAVARITAADATLTYNAKTGRITEVDADETYNAKTPRITAASVDLTYNLAEARIAATDVELDYSVAAAPPGPWVLADALKMRTTRTTPLIVISLPGNLFVRMSTATIRDMSGFTASLFADLYSPSVLYVEDVIDDGAPAIDTATSEVRFGIANQVIATSSGPMDAPDIIRTRAWFGARVTIFLAVEGPDLQVLFFAIFNGTIRSTEVDQQGIHVRAARLSQEHLQTPARQVLSDSLVYTSQEGDEPQGNLGAAVPIFYGRFNVTAVTRAWDALDSAWGDERSDIFPALLGVKYPMVPLVLLSENYRWKSGETALTSHRNLLLAVGDVDNTNGTRILLARHDSTSWEFTPQLFNPPTGNTERIHWSRLYTWNNELDQATAFCKDQSTDMDVAPKAAEKAYASCGEKAVDGTHTATPSLHRFVHTFFIARKDPDWGGSVPTFWSGTLQCMALIPDRVSQRGGITDGVTFGTTLNVQNLEHLFKPNLVLNVGSDVGFASIPLGERISLQMPAVGPNLGEVIAVRICWISDRTQTSTQTRVAARYFPGIGGLVLSTAPGANEWFTTYLSGSTSIITHNPTAVGGGRQFGSFYIWERLGRSGGPASHPVPQWEFVEIDETDGQGYAYDVVFWPGNGIVRLNAVWMEVIYRPSFLNRTARRLPGTSARIAAEGGFDVRGRPRSQERRIYYGEKRVSIPYTGNVPDPQQQPLGQQSVWGSGQGPFHNVRWDFDIPSYVSTVLPFDNPASIALHYIDKYLGDYGACAIGVGELGSFRDAITYYESLGSSPFWRLSVQASTRTGVQVFLDRLAEHGKCFIQRQTLSDGTYKWRIYVDTPTPATDFPARNWRAGEALSVQDIMPETLRVELTGIDAIRNRFVLRYGLHEPTGRFAYERTLNKDSTNLATQGALYRTACSTSETRYADPVTGIGFVQEEIIELPWLWFPDTADEILKWHCNLKRERRVGVTLTGGLLLADIQPGHVVTLADDVANIVGNYPGLSAVSWSSRRFNVVRRTIRLDGGQVLVDLVLLETYSVPV